MSSIYKLKPKKRKDLKPKRWLYKQVLKGIKHWQKRRAAKKRGPKIGDKGVTRVKPGQMVRPQGKAQANAWKEFQESRPDLFAEPGAAPTGGEAGGAPAVPAAPSIGDA